MALRQKQTREQECARINSMKIHNQWRKIMRVAKVEELRGEVEILSQNHEREVDRKDALVQVGARAWKCGRVGMLYAADSQPLQQHPTCTGVQQQPWSQPAAVPDVSYSILHSPGWLVLHERVTLARDSSHNSQPLPSAADTCMPFCARCVCML